MRAVLADTYFSAANTAAGQHGATNTQTALIGSSDAHEAEVKETPISPKDILARCRHLLGIDPDRMIAAFRGIRRASRAMVRARRINRLTIR